MSGCGSLGFIGFLLMLRIETFVLVNPPSIFPAVWKLIKPMMSEELASKFVFVTDDTIGSIVGRYCTAMGLGRSGPMQP